MVREREGARFSPVPNKSKRFCCVYGCKSLSKRDTTVRFHKFPKEGEFVKINNQKADRRKEWIRLLTMVKKVTESMHVCSLHFKKEDYILPDVSATEMPYDSCCIVSNIRCGKYDSNMEYTQYKNSFHIKCDMDLCNLEYLKKSNTLRNWNCKSCSKEVKNSELSQDKQLSNVSASIGINTNTGEMVDDYSDISTNITLTDVMNELKLIRVAQIKTEQSLDSFNKKVNECCSLLKLQNDRITQYIKKIEGTGQY